MTSLLCTVLLMCPGSSHWHAVYSDWLVTPVDGLYCRLMAVKVGFCGWLDDWSHCQLVVFKVYFYSRPINILHYQLVIVNVGF